MNKYRYAALVLGSSLAVGASAFAGTALAGPGGSCAGARGVHGPGARFAELDADKDGKVTLAELTASKESWLASVDTNKDGVASQQELRAGMDARREERLKEMFDSQDENKDGRLARTESRMPSAWFERADANHDGALTLPELREARQNAGPGREGKAGRGREGKARDGAAGPGRAGKPGPERKPGFARLDDNGDGNVDRAELARAAARQLARLDDNGDGSLTSDELRKGHGHGRGRHRKGPAQDAAPKPGPRAPQAS